MTERCEVPALERLTAARGADIVSVFCDAFRDYPVMRYITGPLGDYGARLHHLINFFVGRRVQQGGPLFGIVRNGRLLAAAAMTLPNEPMMPPGAAALRDETWRQLGDDARTETTPNLTLYQHFGYEVQGHVRVTPDLESWGLFLRCR